jgi:hypothetical protein
MSRNQVLFVVTLLACAGAALAIWIIGSLDKEGAPRLGIDPVIGVLLLVPYVIVAAVAVWNREQGIVLAACLLAVTVIAALAIPIQWSDHQAWRREPPGRETQHYGLLAVLFVHWVGSAVLLALAIGYRLITAKRRRIAQPGPPAERR